MPQTAFILISQKFLMFWYTYIVSKTLCIGLLTEPSVSLVALWQLV
jgi:hypothetical protein